MQEWPTEEEETAERLQEDSGRRRLSLRDPGVRDNSFVAVIAAFYVILAGFPLYNLVTGNGSKPQNFSILGGMIGLVIAGCAAMDIPFHWTVRLALGAIGIGMIVGFWGFGPM